MAATGSTRLSSRDLSILYAACQIGNRVTRQPVLAFPKSCNEAQAAPAVAPGVGDSLPTDLEVIRTSNEREKGNIITSESLFNIVRTVRLTTIGLPRQLPMRHAIKKHPTDAWPLLWPLAD